MNRDGYRRWAAYNGDTWDMGQFEPQAFLDDVLAANFPDLRGARFSVEHDDVREETTYTFSRTAGNKGV